MRLHQWDVLRANKAPFAFGLEPRVPFLDKTFLELVMNIDPQEKMVRRAALPLSLGQQCLAPPGPRGCLPEFCVQLPDMAATPPKRMLRAAVGCLTAPHLLSCGSLGLCDRALPLWALLSLLISIYLMAPNVLCSWP